VTLLIQFARGTSLFRERDLVSDLPILRNGPAGTFVVFPLGLRVSLPTDQIVSATDAGGCVRVVLGGMEFIGLSDGLLRFVRVSELRAEEHLSPERSHTMTLDPEWVSSIRTDGDIVWPAA
jgi:hypothetical protein